MENHAHKSTLFQKMGKVTLRLQLQFLCELRSQPTLKLCNIEHVTQIRLIKMKTELHFIAYLQKLNLYISIYHKFVKIYEVLTAS